MKWITERELEWQILLQTKTVFFHSTLNNNQREREREKLLSFPRHQMIISSNVCCLMIILITIMILVKYDGSVESAGNKWWLKQEWKRQQKEDTQVKISSFGCVVIRWKKLQDIWSERVASCDRRVNKGYLWLAPTQCLLSCVILDYSFPSDHNNRQRQECQSQTRMIIPSHHPHPIDLE